MRFNSFISNKFKLLNLYFKFIIDILSINSIEYNLKYELIFYFEMKLNFILTLSK